MPRIYRVVGTDDSGDVQFEDAKATEKGARKAVETRNKHAARLGAPETWRAEYADVEWKALP